jgi:hypothetical protein
MRAGAFIFVYILAVSSLSACSSSAAAERPPARSVVEPTTQQDGVVHIHEASRPFIVTETVSGAKSGESVSAPARWISATAPCRSSAPRSTAAS